MSLEKLCYNSYILETKGLFIMSEEKKYEHYYYSSQQRSIIAENNELEFVEIKVRENYCLINGEKEERTYTGCIVTDSEEKPEKELILETLYI